MKIINDQLKILIFQSILSICDFCSLVSFLGMTMWRDMRASPRDPSLRSQPAPLTRTCSPSATTWSWMLTCTGGCPASAAMRRSTPKSASLSGMSRRHLSDSPSRVHTACFCSSTTNTMSCGAWPTSESPAPANVTLVPPLVPARNVTSSTSACVVTTRVCVSCTRLVNFIFLVTPRMSSSRDSDSFVSTRVCCCDCSGGCEPKAPALNLG
mmetsp:Transcript_105409/g.328581  ORF Transcript_105409/g.328581 Transcript_105409/m.328581 type:complete len:211 (+) Transcript_105409:17-649(+)